MSRRERSREANAKKLTRKSLPLVLAVMLAAALILAFAPASQASPGWSAPVSLSGTDLNSRDPQIALDASGNPHVVWRAYDSSMYDRIWYSENTGSGWSAPLNISPGIDRNNEMPQIALDAGGNPHVVWYGDDGLVGGRIYYSANTGSGWSAPLNISAGLTDNFAPRIALDAGGNPQVVWRGKEGGVVGWIYYSANTGSGWSAPLNISPGMTGNNNPQIALDAGGNPHVAWIGISGSYTRIHYSEKTGSGWSAPLDISPTTIENGAPRIVLDAGGNPHVVWEGWDGSLEMRIYYSENAGGGWSAPLIISTGSTDKYLPQIALDAGGHPYVVWYGSDGVTSQVYYSEKTGSSWSAPLIISTTTTDNTGPQIALDPDGNPHVVWEGKDGVSYRIHYSAKSGSSWSTPLKISTGVTEDSNAQIALDGGGNPHVVWHGIDGSTFRIYYSENVPYNFYFAEGYTGAGFREYLCLGNSSSAPVKVKVAYLVKDGTPSEKTYTVPATSRFTADVNAEVGADKEVSIKCEAAAPFIAERPMYFDYQGGGGSWTGGSDAVGAPLPSTTWYFAEGYTGPGFDEWVCVLNPWGSDAHLTFNFQTQEDGLVVPTGTYSVPANSRATFKANDLLEGKSYQTSLKLTSDVPVVAERPMYFEYQGTGSWGWTGGHDMMGTPTLARDYYFAEGTTRAGFEEWLTLQNPGTSEITVHASYQLGEGAPVEQDYSIPAASRKTLYVPTEAGADKDVSVHLSSASDFLAERPMYFDYQGMGSWGWTGGHCVIGAPSQGTDWFFAEGYTGEGFEEWLCIQNPGAAAAKVRITYYPQGGGAPISKGPITVAANSRYTVYVNSDAGEGLSLCAKVSSDKPVIVERPMYFNFDGTWDGGSDVVGYIP